MHPSSIIASCTQVSTLTPPQQSDLFFGSRRIQPVYNWLRSSSGRNGTPFIHPNHSPLTPINNKHPALSTTASREDKKQDSFHQQQLPLKHAAKHATIPPQHAEQMSTHHGPLELHARWQQPQQPSPPSSSRLCEVVKSSGVEAETEPTGT
ncbi:unnamed protein product [Periconia digitata]|uniref:Uncharacterized protein n=1 Tax=Periconia digitata TaxID=1303443 RepID=A0A9W4U4K7_9PLEO|nr:unnamed protein product [Periconia digitata]